MLLPLLVGGCSPYYDDYTYVPRPALAEIPPRNGTAATQPGSSDSPRVSVLASIVGVHREDASKSIPESVEVRLQLTNDGSQSLTFDPHAMQLSDASLMWFDRPLVQPDQPPITLAPGHTSSVGAYFPFPRGRTLDSTDMNSLQLKWTLQTEGGRELSQTVLFRRGGPSYYYAYPRYYFYDPFWYAPYPAAWHGGLVVVHRHCW
jgi:hypothetical protein